MGKLEHQIEHEILIYLSSLRIGLFWKNVSGGYYDGERFRKQASPFAISGTSDILGIVDGKFICLEVKSETGRVSTVQQAFLKKVQECRGLGAVVRSVDQARVQLQAWGLI